MKLTHASLFSGFGGPDLAARWMDWDNAFHCEINPFCNTILNYHFPKSKSYKDVTTTDFTPWRGKIDVLTGGFPCQPFSVAGQRKGADDNRYLWPHFLRAIREIRPPWVIGENVAGILTMVQPGKEVEVGCQASLFDQDNTETVLEQEFVIETICQDLEREGYSVQPVVIPACAVGAPHRRDRVWFIAHRSNTGVEDVQRERKILSDRFTSNPYSSGSDRTSDEKSGTVKRQDRGKTEQFKFGSGVRPASNSDLNRFRNREDEQKQVSERKGAPDDCACCEDGITTHPDGKRCDNRCNHRDERYFRYDWQRYSKEDKSERDEWKYRSCENGANITYANSPELQEWLKTGRWPDETKARTRMDNGTERSDILQHASYSGISGLQRNLQPEHNAPCRRKASYGFPPEYAGNSRRTLLATFWQDFPTQSPVCSGNDGISSRLVRESVLAQEENKRGTFTVWREESVKGYGNAIVPQVILEIFKAIEETYK